MRKLFCYFTAILFAVLALCSLTGAIFYDALHQLWLLVPELIFAVMYFVEAKKEEA